MENASKALIIAGEVLIGALILALLIYSVSRWSNVKKVELSSEQIEQIVEYNKSFEAYNRNNLYGNDIISVINKVEDYNKKESEVKGYKQIELKITIKNAVVGSKYFQAKTYNFTQLRDNYNELKEKIDSMLEKKYNGKDLVYYSGLTSIQLEEKLNDLVAMGVIKNTNEISEKIDAYTVLSTELKEFKKKKFECTNVEYDEIINRINKLEFEEQ